MEGVRQYVALCALVTALMCMVCAYAGDDAIHATFLGRNGPQDQERIYGNVQHARWTSMSHNAWEDGGFATEAAARVFLSGGSPARLHLHLRPLPSRTGPGHDHAAVRSALDDALGTHCADACHVTEWMARRAVLVIGPMPAVAAAVAAVNRARTGSGALPLTLQRVPPEAVVSAAYADAHTLSAPAIMVRLARSPGPASEDQPLHLRNAAAAAAAVARALQPQHAERALRLTVDSAQASQPLFAAADARARTASRIVPVGPRTAAIVPASPEEARTIIARLAADPHVLRIEPFSHGRTATRFTQSLVQSGVWSGGGGTTHTPFSVSEVQLNDLFVPSDHADPIAYTPAFAAGMFGAGFVLATLDTGADVSHCSLSDPSVAFSVNTTLDNHRKIYRYDALFDGVDHVRGHGTALGSTALGNPLDTLETALTNISLWNRGIAPLAKLWVQDRSIPQAPRTIILPSDIQKEVLAPPADAGVSTRLDGWSTLNLGGYSTLDRDFDAFLHNHTDVLSVISVANYGFLGPGGVPSPAQSKNPLIVGATGMSLYAGISFDMFSELFNVQIVLANSTPPTADPASYIIHHHASSTGPNLIPVATGPSILGVLADRSITMNDQPFADGWTMPTATIDLSAVVVPAECTATGKLPNTGPEHLAIVLCSNTCCGKDLATTFNILNSLESPNVGAAIFASTSTSPVLSMVHHVWLGEDLHTPVMTTTHELGQTLSANAYATIKFSGTPPEQSILSVITDDDIPIFSSVGPSGDGRFTPQIVAPGLGVECALSTGRAPDSGPDGALPPIVCGRSTYDVQHGTSLAAAHVAGAALVAREWFNKTQPTDGISGAKIATPSGPLLKAVLLNGAASLYGFRSKANATVPIQPAPAFSQGYGRLVLNASIPFQPQQAQGPPGAPDPDPARGPGAHAGGPAALGANLPSFWMTRSGRMDQGARAFSLCVTLGTEAPSSPTPGFSATLAWYDPLPGPSDIRALVNDLSMVLIRDDGARMYGNGLVNSVDELNTVERITMPTDKEGGKKLTLHVWTPTSFTGGAAQDYALAIRGPPGSSFTTSMDGCPAVCDAATTCSGHGVCLPDIHVCYCTDTAFTGPACDQPVDDLGSGHVVASLTLGSRTWHYWKWTIPDTADLDAGVTIELKSNGPSLDSLPWASLFVSATHAPSFDSWHGFSGQSQTGHETIILFGEQPGPDMPAEPAAGKPPRTDGTDGPRNATVPHRALTSSVPGFQPGSTVFIGAYLMHLYGDTDHLFRLEVSYVFKPLGPAPNCSANPNVIPITSANNISLRVCRDTYQYLSFTVPNDTDMDVGVTFQTSGPLTPPGLGDAAQPAVILVGRAGHSVSKPTEQDNDGFSARPSIEQIILFVGDNSHEYGGLSNFVYNVSQGDILTVGVLGTCCDDYVEVTLNSAWTTKDSPPPPPPDNADCPVPGAGQLSPSGVAAPAHGCVETWRQWTFTVPLDTDLAAGGYILLEPPLRNATAAAKHQSGEARAILYASLSHQPTLEAYDAYDTSFSSLNKRIILSDAEHSASNTADDVLRGITPGAVVWIGAYVECCEPMAYFSLRAELTAVGPGPTANCTPDQPAHLDTASPGVASTHTVCPDTWTFVSWEIPADTDMSHPITISALLPKAAPGQNSVPRLALTGSHESEPVPGRTQSQIIMSADDSDSQTIVLYASLPSGAPAADAHLGAGWGPKQTVYIGMRGDCCRGELKSDLVIQWSVHTVHTGATAGEIAGVTTASIMVTLIGVAVAGGVCWCCLSPRQRKSRGVLSGEHTSGSLGYLEPPTPPQERATYGAIPGPGNDVDLQNMHPSVPEDVFGGQSDDFHSIDS